jgi:hypothetical protein
MKSRIMPSLALGTTLLLGGCETHDQNSPSLPGEARICADSTPFISASYAVFIDLLDPKKRRSVAAEVFRHNILTEETLDKRTPYFVQLAKPTDERSAISIRHGKTSWVLVTAFVFDQTAYKARPRYGLIPFWAYDDFLKSLSKQETTCRE